MGSSTFGPNAPRPFRQDVSAQSSSIGSYVAGKGKRLSSSADSPKQGNQAVSYTDLTAVKFWKES